MSKSHSLADAQAHLAEYVAAVEAGERVVLTKNGSPVAALVSIADLERFCSASGEDETQAGLAKLFGTWDEDPEGEAAIASVIAERPAGRCLSDPAG